MTVAIPIPVFRYGLGDQQAAEISSSVASALGTAAAVTPPPVNIILGAAAAAAAIVAACEEIFSGCGATCTEATEIVNQVEPYLQQNNQNYFSNPNRTTMDQAMALAAASQIFGIIQQNCGNAALGKAGENCISERIGNGMAQGSNTCSFGLTYADEYPPYSSTPYPVGVCWTWTLAYYDSIANDVPPGGGLPLPLVEMLANLGLSLTQTVFGIPVIYIAAGGILLGALLLLGVI